MPVDHDPFGSRKLLATVPTTEAQREIWTATSISDEASCAYNESVSLELTGRLDKQAILKAIQMLVARHESLRSLVNKDGTRLLVLEDQSFDYFEHDLLSKGQEEREAYLKKLGDEIMNKPFDLHMGPVFRADLVLCSKDLSLLRLTAHHIVCDGWSLGIMMADIGSFYTAFATGAQPELPDVIPFREYVKESVAFSKTKEAKATKQFWLDQYAGDIPRVDLPTDRRRPSMKTYSGDRLDVTVSPELVAKLKSVSTRSGSSLVTTLLTCFEILVHKLTRQEDVVMGLPAAGQSDMDMRELVGHCVNLLPLRSKIDPSMAFVDHLKARRTAVLDAYDNQRFTFGTLINELRVPREPGRIPLVPVVFNIDMNMDDGVAFEQLTHRFISEPRQFENFELFLNATGSEENLVLEWSYNTDLFDRATITNWSDQLVELITSVAADPSQRIRDLGSSVIDLAESTSVKPSWEGSVKLMPTDSTVDGVFSRICKAYPDRIAMVHGNQKLTYSELETRVNVICAELINKGVKRGQYVGLSMDRSFDMIASMLATLKAGAAFVPLDPAYPSERLKFMLEDTNVKVLIVSDESKQHLPEHSAEEIRPSELSSTNSVMSISPGHGTNDPAYVMYTSGSTGTPKGAVIPHRAIIRLVNDQDFLPFSKELTFLQLSNTSFDASTLEIWGALLNGAKLVLQPQQKPTLEEITDTIKQENVTSVWLTTGLFNLLVDERLDDLVGLKHIFTGGDVVSVPHVTKAFNKLGAGVIHNGYGPTENTTFTCTYRVNDIRSIANGVPIGQPISDTTVYVLDPDGERVKVGEEGELYAGGNGLALGYLNRPELNEDRFVSNPLNPSEKLYRTGDLVKWNPDGTIAFVGRADGQVKIRGFRIELGEIEQALDSFDPVKDRVVICREDKPGQKELVAYIVPASSEEDGRSVVDLSDHGSLSVEVREHLEGILPAHMIPTGYVVMEQLPLTANGKIDKRALPKPERKTAVMEAKYVGPRDNLERILAGIWSDILEIDKIGVRDNFFEIGGHSLIGIQLFAAIKAQLGKELPLKTLFHAPTIASQAKLIKDQGWKNNWENLTAIQPEGSRTPFFAVHADEANYFIPKAWGKDQPYYGFFHQGEDGHRIQYTSVEEIARHFIQELKSVKPQGPYLLGGYSFGGIVAFEMAQQLKQMGDSVPLLALFDTYDPVEYLKVMKEESKFYDGLKKAVLRTMAQRYLKKGKILPGKLRHFYIIDTYDEAIRNYKAKPYDGTITVLKAKNSAGNEKMGWDKWAESLDIKVLPGDHYSIVKEPHVYDLAKALQASIEKAIHVTEVEAI